MRPHALYGAFLAVFVLVGCAGMPKVDTPPEAFKALTDYTTTLVLSLNEANRLGSLSDHTHSQALDIAQDMHDAIQAANDAYRLGYIWESQSHLDTAEAALRTLIMLLARRES